MLSENWVTRAMETVKAEPSAPSSVSPASPIGVRATSILSPMAAEGMRKLRVTPVVSVPAMATVSNCTLL